MRKKLDISVTKQRRLLAGMLFCSFLSSCAAVPTEPNGSLVQFSKSIETLKTDTESSFKGITVASEAQFKADLVEELEEGETDSLNSVLIETNSKTLRVEKAPYYLKIKRLKTEVGLLNTSLLDYVNLLTKLSNPDAISTTTFDSLATHLNTNILGLVPSIKSETGRADTGLFSLTAMALTKNYLKSKQSGLLVNAIRGNQPTIEHFSSHLQRSVRIISQELVSQYNDEIHQLKLQVIKTKARAAIVDQIIARNKTHYDALQTLKRILSNYQRLPLMHAEVADVIQAGNRGASSMMRMLEATSKLNHDYKKTLSPNAPLTAPVPAPAAIPIAPAPVVNPTQPSS